MEFKDSSCRNWRHQRYRQGRITPFCTGRSAGDSLSKNDITAEDLVKSKVLPGNRVM
jgi:hypothetical protein